MVQQLIAVAVILYIILKIIQQWKRRQIGRNELLLWLMFWTAVLAAIIFIKKIDALVADLGFSAAGIDVLLYLSVAYLFYYIFKLRVKLEKTEKNITKIIRHIGLNE